MQDMRAKKRTGRIGRPPLPPEKRRGALVTLRMTSAERKQVEKDAEKAGLCYTVYLLKCWREARSGKHI